MESSIEQRQIAIRIKKQRLEELKSRREQRKQESASKAPGNESPIHTPTPLDPRTTDVNSWIKDLLAERESRPASTQPGSPAGAGRATRPVSDISAGQLSSDNDASSAYQTPAGMVDREVQTLASGPLPTVHESDDPTTSEAKKEHEVNTYSKGVQVSIDWSPPKPRGAGASDSEPDESPTRSPKSKRVNRRQKERDDEIRAQLRKEIEQELRAVQQAPPLGLLPTGSVDNFPFKTLTNEELAAVESSEDFLGFVERSTKVLERALDQQLGYDILADYALGGLHIDEEDEGYGSSGAKKGRRIKEIAQFWDERWSKKRMVSDLAFSSKVSMPQYGHCPPC